MAYAEDNYEDEFRNGAALREAMRGQQQAPGQQPPTINRDAPGTTEPMDLSDYARRGGPGGHKSAMGSAASGALTGATYGSVVPVLGTALGAGIGATYGGIKGAIQRRASSAPTDFLLADAQDAINKTFQQTDSRDATASEIDGALRGQGWKPGDRYVGEKGLTSTLAAIQNNARQHAQAQGQAQAAPTETVPNGPTQPAVQPTQSAQPATGVGNHLGRGFDHDRIRSNGLRSTGVQSYKDTVGRISSNFDPRAGVTPELLAALNAEGLATFSGSKDRLGYSNVTEKGRQAEMLGDTNENDIIGNYGIDSADWQFAGGELGGGGGEAPQAGGATPGMFDPNTSGAFAPTDAGFFQRIMQQLAQQNGGSGQPDDRAALENLMRQV